MEHLQLKATVALSKFRMDRARIGASLAGALLLIVGAVGWFLTHKSGFRFFFVSVPAVLLIFVPNWRHKKRNG